MWSRLSLALAALFWILMNVLLWRAEFRPEGEPGALVPVEVVWGKMLTAPDFSNLEIRQHGQKIGYCRWFANVGEAEATGQTMREEYRPEAQIRKLTHYTIDLDGTIFLGAPSNRFRFFTAMQFGTDHNWEEFSLRVNQRPAAWEIRALKEPQTVNLLMQDETLRWDQTFTFAELREPEKILRQLAGPWLAAMVAGQVGAGAGDWQRLAASLTWEARNDWLKIGAASARVYRLRARLLDRYEATFYISRVGEVLRVELPNNITLLNDELGL